MANRPEMTPCAASADILDRAITDAEALREYVGSFRRGQDGEHAFVIKRRCRSSLYGHVG